jgi:hypothetical protein
LDSGSSATQPSVVYWLEHRPKFCAGFFTSLYNGILGRGYSMVEYMKLFAFLFEVFSVMRKSSEMALKKRRP